MGIQFRAVFCYAAQMKNERLRALIEQINKGQLSRNKNFEAFKDPVVRNAREKSNRLTILKQILGEAETVSLEREGERRWKLSCRFPKWDFSWSAWLLDVEVSLLREDAEIEKILQQ